MMIKQHKKGQVAYEFLIVFLMISFIFTIITMYVGDRQGEELQKQQDEKSMQLGIELQELSIVASQMSSGFERTFTLPYTIGGKDYDVLLLSEYDSFCYVVISLPEYDREYLLPSCVGKLKKGENILINNNSILCFNGCGAI